MSNPQRTLDVLRDAADKDGLTTITDAQLATALGLSRRTVYNDLAALRGSNAIENADRSYVGQKHVRTIRVLSLED